MTSRPWPRGAALFVAASAIAFSARASAPAGRYAVSSGTVTDTKTKLVWPQTWGSTKVTADGAKAFCAGGGSAGRAGWRLPTLKELMTLIDYSKASAPYIDTGVFLNVPTDATAFWTATNIFLMVPTANRTVSFSTGKTSSATTDTPLYAICVR